MTPVTSRTTAARRTLLLVATLGAAGLLGLLAPSCANPITDDAIEALGEERPGDEPGPFHRSGQPCVLCHSIAGGADPVLVLGGTVFADQSSFLPVEGARVIVYDAVGDEYAMVSNCVGNFYLEDEGSIPQFPLAVEVECPRYDAEGNQLDTPKVIAMNSWISRDGSCATCHSLEGKEVDSTGWIFCNDAASIATNPYPPYPDSCAGVPPQAVGAETP